MLPICRLTGCSVDETSRDAFLIKTLQVFSEGKGGCQHCEGSLLTGDEDMTDYHVEMMIPYSHVTCVLVLFQL